MRTRGGGREEGERGSERGESERASKTERARGAIGGRAYKGRAPENQSKLKAVSPQQ